MRFLRRDWKKLQMTPLVTMQAHSVDVGELFIKGMEVNLMT